MAHFLYKHKIIDEFKVDVCQYGYEIIISTLIGFSLVVAIGLILSETVEAFLFYILFITIRLFTGGYHASTHFKCKMTLSVCCATALFLSKVYYCVTMTAPLLLMAYLITVIAYSPIENANAPLTEKIKQRNRRISIIMAVIFTI